jgi:polar amino acid transport system substrate-binding protein
VLIPPIQPGDGTDLLDRLLEKGILRVGIRVWPEAEFSPPAFRGFSNAAVGGALNGFEVEVARLLATFLGLELELVEAYPPIIDSGDWRGEWDIAIASLVPLDEPPPETVSPLSYSRPYAYMPTGIFVPETSPVGSAIELSGRQIGVFEHSVYQRLFSNDVYTPTVAGQPLSLIPPSDVQLVVLSNMQKTLREMGDPTLNGGTPDAIVGPAPVLEQAISANVLSFKVIRDPANLPAHPLVVAVVAQDGLAVERLTAEINTILERLERQGTLAELSLRWYNQDLSQPP